MKESTIPYFGSAFPGRGRVPSTGSLASAALSTQALAFSPITGTSEASYGPPGNVKGEGAQQGVTGLPGVLCSESKNPHPISSSHCCSVRTPPSQCQALTLHSLPSMPHLLTGLPRRESLLSCPPPISPGIACIQWRRASWFYLTLRSRVPACR